MQAETVEIQETVAAATALFLIIMLWVLGTFFYTDYLKRSAGMCPPEDYVVADVPVATPALLDRVDRWKRISNDDLENVPFGIIAMFVSAYLIPFTDDVRLIRFQICCASFWVGLRIVHTIVFGAALQPLRSIVYTLAVIFLLLLVILSVVGAFLRPELIISL